jgi:hypothetical protein
MTERERVAYVQRQALTRQQRQELLKANEAIATLLQQDAFWKHRRKNLELFKITVTRKW